VSEPADAPGTDDEDDEETGPALSKKEQRKKDKKDAKVEAKQVPPFSSLSEPPIDLIPS